MDTTREIYNLPIHKHPLFLSTRFIIVECGGCHVDEINYSGYFCSVPYCYSWFHKECAEAPPEISHHPSHSEHPLLLTNDSPMGDGGTTPCDCCGKELLYPCYICSTCEFKVDLICGMKPSPPAIDHPMWHDHSLVFLKKGEVDVPCEVCKEYIGGPSYSCLECHVYFHLDCVHLSKETFHPCHPSHPLKIVTSDQSFTDIHDAETSCHFCEVQPKVLYHCFICNFTMCFRCTKKPPPLVIENTKIHKHPFRLFSSHITFTCKLCGNGGSKGNNKPYICFECNVAVDGKCLALPQVININRHDHRISFTHHLGQKGTKCGVCWRNVSQYYGAYFCSVCPNYTVHSLCAYDYNVWNGVELEGIPESSEDTAPFKVVGRNLIRHFSHSEHTLRLLKGKAIHDDEFVRCEACVRPVGFGPIYSCKTCCFVLHRKCANLPLKKRLVFDPAPYTLELVRSAKHCKLCGMLCDGFRYTSQGAIPRHHIDVHCGSLSEPFVHNAHLHPLYFAETRYGCCHACNRVPHNFLLRCRACKFYLCLYCASLPDKIWHMTDEHPLILSYDGIASDQNWCEVCESELDPSKWLFTCSDCEVTLHVQCALGDFSRLKPGHAYTYRGRDYEVVLNNRNTRPFCSRCHSRCKVPVILNDYGKDNGYICSKSCLSSFSGIQFGK